MWSPPTAKDLEWIEKQLGRRPRGVVGVAWRDRSGAPGVVVTAPLLSEGRAVASLEQLEPGARLQAFPTLFWLTAPHLTRAVSQLESAGWIGRLGRVAAESPQWQRAMRLAHEANRRLRLRLVGAPLRRGLRRSHPRLYSQLADGGVAGIQNAETGGLKCLHAHLADYLARRSNPAGRWVLGRLLQSGVDVAGPDGSGLSEEGPERGPLAAVDVGSNSVRLLVAALEGGSWRVLRRELHACRLADGLDRSGRLSREARKRTLSALRRCARSARRHGATGVWAVGTEALRRAEDAWDLLAEIWESSGIAVRVINGEEEAGLSFHGVYEAGGAAGDGAAWLIDVGGASTEFAAGRAGRIEAMRSVPIGVVTATQRFFASDPPTGEELAALRLHLREAFAEACRQIRRESGVEAERLFAVGGTATTAAAIDQGVEPYDPDCIHGSRLPAERLSEWAERLAAMDEAGRRKVRGLHPSRAGIIVAGLVILDEAARSVRDAAGGRALVEVSEADLLLGLLAARGRPPEDL